jgi:hypothetical protein
MNFEPGRPEAEIMQEYADAWDYLYEPSRYLARAYRYYLAMRPARRDKAMGAEGPPGRENVPDRIMAWRRRIRAIVTILWRQGVRASYRRQFWTQLIGMGWQNPSRLVQYFTACAMGEDLYHLRKVVREKGAAIIKALDQEVSAAKSWGRAATQ